MNISEIVPEFIIIENDPIILMDLRDLILHEFERLALCLDALDGLVELLAEINGPTVVIGSCDPDEYVKTVHASGLHSASSAAVLLSESSTPKDDFPKGVSVIPSPFTSDTLLASIKNAFAHLHSSHS